MLIKTIRIHYIDDSIEYELYDRDGKFHKKLSEPISICNLKVKRFGFCIIGSVDVTLELETPIDEKDIKITR